MASKTRLQCEGHYYNFYYCEADSPEGSSADRLITHMEEKMIADDEAVASDEDQIDEEMDKQNLDAEKDMIKKLNEMQGKVPVMTPNKDNQNRSRSIVKNRNKKDQTPINSASEIL